MLSSALREVSVSGSQGLRHSSPVRVHGNGVRSGSRGGSARSRMRSGGDVAVLQAELVALVEDRAARKRQEQKERGLVLALVAAGPASRHPRVVVVRPEPDRLASFRQLLHRRLDDRPQLVEVELGSQEWKVLREVEVRVVVEELVERNVGLAHQSRLRDVLARDLLPAAVDLVHLRPLRAGTSRRSGAAGP